MIWSGRRDSNPRPTAWKAVTLPLSYSRLSCFRSRFPRPVIGGQGRIRTSVARSAADLQSAAINHSATCPSSSGIESRPDPRPPRRPRTATWSRRWDLNPQPSDYTSDALPLSYAGDDVLRKTDEILRSPGRPSKSRPIPTARTANPSIRPEVKQGPKAGQ